MESKFYYITVSTRPHPILDKLKQKVAGNGESITVLGESDTRFIGWQGSVNFGVKLREVSNFIRQAELNDGDIILFTDAYDVAYFGNKEGIIERFLEFEKPIVFGCEKVCHPDPELSVNYTSLNNSICTADELSTKLPVTDLNIATQRGADSNLHQYKFRKHFP